MLSLPAAKSAVALCTDRQTAECWKRSWLLQHFKMFLNILFRHVFDRPSMKHFATLFTLTGAPNCKHHVKQKSHQPRMLHYNIIIKQSLVGKLSKPRMKDWLKVEVFRLLCRIRKHCLSTLFCSTQTKRIQALQLLWMPLKCCDSLCFWSVLLKSKKKKAHCLITRC